MMYTYDIRPDTKLRGGGWSLHLFENGQAAGLVDFPATEQEDSHIDALKAAFVRAEAEARLWVNGRKVYSKRRKRLVVQPALAALLGLVVVVSLYNTLKYVL